MNPHSESVPGIRLDIQALRGLAVLMVVLYHFKLGGVRSGYLGVDIFFVISGYLITSLVAAGIERGGFRLTDFYFKRAKRLLPAAYVTILVTVVCAPWLLNHQDLRDFARQVIGAITFTANFFLWQQTGYFEGASHMKPLLHTWSLSLEEQYYLVVPAALLLLPRRFWLRAVLTALAASLVLCVIGTAVDPVATFYLLPTRAWELLLGSMGALLAGVSDPAKGLRIGASRPVRLLFYPSLAVLMLVPMLPSFWRHPGAAALLVCVATLVVILRRHAGLAALLPTRMLARLGDISYSLYLVHWPVIVFIRHAWLGRGAELPLSLRIATLAISLALSVLLYRLIEDPVRKAPLRFTWAVAGKIGLASTALMVLVPLWMVATKTPTNYAEIRRINLGLAAECRYETPFRAKAECTTGAQKTLVWGDSYAMHLVAGLNSQPAVGGVVQATRSVCGPFLDLAPRRLQNPGPGPDYDERWAGRCIEFNRSVLDFVRLSKTVEVVVVSSPLGQYVDDGWMLMTKVGQGLAESAPAVEEAAAALARTAQEVRAAGKKIVFFAPPPAADFDIGACLERHLTGRLSFGGHPGCTVPVAAYQARRAGVLKLTDAIERAGIPVIRMSDFLCDPQTCATMLDGTLVYRDEGHLSYDGSRLLAARMDWARLVRERAR